MEVMICKGFLPQFKHNDKLQWGVGFCCLYLSICHCPKKEYIRTKSPQTIQILHTDVVPTLVSTLYILRISFRVSSSM